VAGVREGGQEREKSVKCIGRDWTEAWYVAPGFSRVAADNFHGVKDKVRDMDR
jgi:hypothetical protein